VSLAEALEVPGGLQFEFVEIQLPAKVGGRDLRQQFGALPGVGQAGIVPRVVRQAAANG